MSSLPGYLQWITEQGCEIFPWSVWNKKKNPTSCSIRGRRCTWKLPLLVPGECQKETNRALRILNLVGCCATLWTRSHTIHHPSCRKIVQELKIMNSVISNRSVKGELWMNLLKTRMWREIALLQNESSRLLFKWPNPESETFHFQLT